MERLSREQIRAALDLLNGRLGQEGKHAQLYLVGGAVLCLIHEVRSSTKDDAAKAFIPKGAGFDRWRSGRCSP